MFQVVPGTPLILAANRDERLDRPAVAMTVLRERQPRILGGQDLLAGGTWLAVSERGLAAGLTNQPTVDGRDPAKRSRGELPLTCAGHSTAAEAVDGLLLDTDPAQYNPCWMLVGDRDTLFSAGITPDLGKPDVRQLEPGVHVLENMPLGAPSAKVDFVRQLITQALAERSGPEPAATVRALRSVLSDHRPAVPEPRTDASGRVRPASLTAACVHAAGGYGTRWSGIVTVPAAGLPSLLIADGKPCETPMRDASGLWAANSPTDPAG